MKSPSLKSNQSKNVLRKPIHQRRIDCDGYLRDDGLWDIEAQLVDTKNYAFETIERGILNEGEPVHDLTLCLTLNDEFQIKSIHCEMKKAPFSLCQKVPPRLDGIIGISIKKHWLKEVNAVIQNNHSCTHLMEMMKIIATTAFQTIPPFLMKERVGPKVVHPSIIDQCQGFSKEGEVVRKHFPQYL